MIHAGEKPFPWCFCDKTFAYHATAKKHELVHTGDKSYACSVCEKKFRPWNTLKRHEKNLLLVVFVIKSS